MYKLFKDEIVKFLFFISLIASSSVFSAEYIVKLRSSANLTNLLYQSFDGPIDEVAQGNTFLIKTDQKSRLIELSNHPDVEYIEPNYRISIDDDVLDVDVVKDPKFSKQWGLKNKYGVDINIEKAWEMTKGSKDIKIAVIDTGIDYNHPDLKDQMWVNEAELNGEKGVDDDGNGYIDDIHGANLIKGDGDPMDDQGHGTHCAGVIGATHNNKGIAGVMANVQLMGLKFLDSSGRGDVVAAIKAIDYAIAQKVDIMSNSWGSTEESKALEEAVQRASDAGIVFVVAAGNAGTNNDNKPFYPANYNFDNVITVAAHDKKGAKARFSNFGKETVHIYAPGTSILSTLPWNRYGKRSGTSMAAPFVSGIIGLQLAMGEGLLASDIKERIIKTSVTSRRLENTVSQGRVDAFRVLTDLRN